MNKSDLLKKQIKNVKKWPKKAGKAELLRHLNGERLTRDEAIHAKCFDCVGGEDTEPCLSVICPLQGFCQWNKPKKATVSKANINSPDAPQSISQDTPDQIMTEED